MASAQIVRAALGVDWQSMGESFREAAEEKIVLPTDDLPRVIEADYVIFGAGVAGLATAAFLRKRLPQNTRIVVVERGRLNRLVDTACRMTFVQEKQKERKAKANQAAEQESATVEGEQMHPNSNTIADQLVDKADPAKRQKTCTSTSASASASEMQQSAGRSRRARLSKAMVKNAKGAETTQTDYGITIAPNGTRMISMLSAMTDADLLEMLDASELQYTLVRDQSNPDIPPMPFPWSQIFGSPSIFCRRTQLLGLLFALCVEGNENPDSIRFMENREIVRVSDNEVEATDDKGTSYRAKLFICADGINKIGRQVVRRCNDPKLTLQRTLDLESEKCFDDNIIQCAYMGVVSRDATILHPLLRKVLQFDFNAPQTLANWVYDPAVGAVRQGSAQDAASELSKPPEERQRRIIVYPLDGYGNFQLFAYFHANDATLKRFGRSDRHRNAATEGESACLKGPSMLWDVSPLEARAEFSMFHENLLCLFDMAKPLNLCLIRDSDPLPKWEADGRAVVIGDAAHAVSPHTGQGASQALEDAEALSMWLSIYEELLSNDVAIPLQHILQMFEGIRLPRANRVTEVARLASGLKPGLANLDIAQYCQYIMGWRGADDYRKSNEFAFWDDIRAHCKRTGVQESLFGPRATSDEACF